VPHYYPVMKKLNAKGPEILGNLPRVPDFRRKRLRAIEKKAGALVDTRTMLAFGGGHIPGCAEHRWFASSFDLGRLDARIRTSRFC
jgi:hypothetical protein